MTEYVHSLLIHDGVLIVPLQGDMVDSEVESLQETLLERVKKSGVKKVLIDVSGLESIDLYLARKLKDTVSMVALMDAEAIIAGFRPDSAIILSQMEIDLDGIKMAPNLDTGINLLKRKEETRKPSKQKSLPKGRKKN